ncbi:hypothetical protein [Alicyclobacillus vulcanalis]|uniref:Uncharacterized protein n=1 Tax=Alicyclobacillus vulcanalis TaxID=252246 RepID=A0A1N7M0P7_9BACL|nr:hypothetical protein [Alicyclobacillus vulcanalis]SIS79501.1 hypothetical protein SAMN05421799_104121 [Alicyclobacillus vulcanalis]
MRDARFRQYFWIFIVILAAVLLKIRIGGSVPYPPSYDKLPGGEIRVHVAAKPVPANSVGEAWNLQKHVQNGQVIYTANLYMNGNEQLIFPGIGVKQKTPEGVLYASSGKIRFNGQDYEAVDLFVDRDGRAGYIDFAKAKTS